MLNKYIYVKPIKNITIMLKTKVLALAIIVLMSVTCVSCMNEKPLGKDLSIFCLIKDCKVYYGVRNTASNDTILRPIYKAILHDENFIWAIKQQEMEIYNLSDCSLFGKFQMFTRYEMDHAYYVGTFPTKKERCYYFSENGRKEELDPDNVLMTLSHFVIMSDSTWELLNYWGSTVQTIPKPITIITNNDGIYAYAYKNGSTVVLKELTTIKMKTFSFTEWNEYKKTTNFSNNRQGCEIRQSRHKLD